MGIGSSVCQSGCSMKCQRSPHGVRGSRMVVVLMVMIVMLSMAVLPSIVVLSVMVVLPSIVVLSVMVVLPSMIVMFLMVVLLERGRAIL